MRSDNYDFKDLPVQAMTLGKDTPVSRCVNLRPTADATALEAVGTPRLLLDDDALRAPSGGRYAPLAGGMLADGMDWLLLACGEQLALYADDTLTHLGSCGATPLCAVSAGLDITVMTDRGPATVTTDIFGEWELTPPASELPGLHLFAGEQSTVSGNVGAFALTTPLPTWGLGMDTRDHKLLTGALLTAYSQMGASCAAAGSYFQPVLARVKLFDASGALLATGPTTALTSRARWGATDSVAATVARDTDGNFFYVGPSVITAPTFKVCLCLPSRRSLSPEQRAAAAKVAYAEIYVIPQSHTADYSAFAEFRQEGGEGATAILRSWMPGASEGHCAKIDSFTRRFGTLPSAMEQLEQKVATVTDPFGRDEAEVFVAPRLSTGVMAQSPQEEIALLGKTLDKMTAAWTGTASDSSLSALYSHPHRFAARAVCSSGSHLIWANLRRLPFAGYDADALTVGETAETAMPQVAEASVRVTIRTPDGRSFSVVTTGKCRAATTQIPPLLTYPDPRATALEMRLLMTDGTCREFSCVLEPSADGKFACWLAEGLAPGELRTASAYTPFEPQNIDAATDSGVVMRCDAEAPLTPLAVARVADSPVMQVLPSWGANANWDYACGRFYLFTRSGVMALAVTSKGSLRASLIDPRPLSMPYAAAMTPQGVVAALGADIVRLSGTKASPLVRCDGVERIGYDRVKGELWLCRADGVTVLSLRDSTYFTRTMPGITSALTAGTRLTLADDAGLHLAGDEEGATTSGIEWEAALPDLRGRSGYCLTEMSAAMFDGEVTFSGGGTGISSTRLRGPLTAPVLSRPLGPLRTAAAISIRGYISTPFTLSRVRLIRHKSLSHNIC